MSPLAEALLINGLLLTVTLEADLGPHRKIGAFRLLRPVVTAGAIIPLFLTAPATRGAGLALESAGAALGVLVGLAAVRLTTVYRSPRTGRPVSRAGLAYAALWTGVAAARTAFSYGAVHWFGPQLAGWSQRHQVPGGVIADVLILMALGMVLVRTAGLGLRAAALPSDGRPARAVSPARAPGSC